MSARDELLSDAAPDAPSASAEGFGADDLLWGAEEIGAYIRRRPGQVYYLHSAGVFGDAVTKAGTRTLVGSKRRLDQLVPRLFAQAPLAASRGASKRRRARPVTTTTTNAA